MGHSVPSARRIRSQTTGVVGLVHEARQRRERSARQKLEIAPLPLGQKPVGPVRRQPLELAGPLAIDHQVDQLVAMGG